MQPWRGVATPRNGRNVRGRGCYSNGRKRPHTNESLGGALQSPSSLAGKPPATGAATAPQLASQRAPQRHSISVAKSSPDMGANVWVVTKFPFVFTSCCKRAILLARFGLSECSARSLNRFGTKRVVMGAYQLCSAREIGRKSADVRKASRCRISPLQRKGGTHGN